MDMTYAMSNKTLDNISLLDLPAFGSKIGNLNPKQKKEPNWPIETNFALWRSNSENLSQVFLQYKTLLGHWTNHMDRLYEPDKITNFTEVMEKNIFLNFTSIITAHMKTFLMAVTGTISKYFYVQNRSLLISGKVK